MNHFETVEIKEGIRLHLIPDYKFKTYGVGIFLHCPLSSETATMNAMLPAVLKRGSQSYPSAQEISARLEELYGASISGGISKRGEDHIISFCLEGVAGEFLPEDEDTFQASTELLFDILLHPNCEDDTFPKDVMEQEKENLKTAIEGLVNDKRGYAIHRTIEEMFHGETFGVPSMGDLEHLASIDGKNLYRHYREVLGAAPIDIFMLGNFVPEAATARIKELCIAFSPRNASIPVTDLAKPAQGDALYRTESMDITQGKLVMGLTTEVSQNDDDYFPLLVANSIFGSGTHSKLFNHVREKLSLAYYVVSRIDSVKGIMLIDAGILFENEQKTIDEIRDQLQAVQNGDISEFEFSSAVGSLANSYRSMKDSIGAVESYYLGQLCNRTVISPDEAVEKIKAVTLDEVIAVSQRIREAIVYFLKD